MKLSTIGGALALVASVALAGCFGETNSGGGVLPDPTVRFFNISPDAGTMDYLLNDEERASAVPYLGTTPNFVSFDFLSTNEGGYDVSCRLTGDTLELDRFVASPPVFQRDTDNLVISVGLPNPGGETLKRTQLLIWNIDRTPPNGNKARMYVLNALVRAPGFENDVLTLQTIDPGNPASIDNPLFSRENVQYATQLGGSPFEIDSGTFTFIARRGESGAAVEVARREFNFASGGIYLAVMSGVEGSSNPALAPSVNFIEIQPDTN